MSTVQVDREYLWALEVVALSGIVHGGDVPRSDFKEAKKILENANLKRPIDRK